MQTKRISALPVISEGSVIGVITSDDILLAGSMSSGDSTT